MSGTPPEAELIALLRSQVQEQLAQRLHPLFDELDARLFDLAERSRAASQQQAYFDALRALRSNRAIAESAFLDRIGIGLGEEPRSDSHHATPGPLSLLEKDEQEEALILESLILRTSTQLARPLETLVARICEASGQQAPAAIEDNHLSPRGLSRLFRNAMAQTDVGIEMRLIAFGLFGHHVLGSLGDIYRFLNRLLAEHGILPDLPDADFLPPTHRPAIRHTPPRRIPDTGPRGEAGNIAQATPVTLPDGNDQRLGELRELVRMQRPVGAAIEGAPAHGDGPPVNPLPDSALEVAIDQLWTFEGDPLSFKPQLIASARALVNHPDAPLASDREDIVDLVGLMFSHIRKDGNLPAPLRNILSRLQLPFLRTALDDPDLLHGESHPARELLDELGALAIGWSPITDPNDALLKQVALIVERLASHHDQDQPIGFSEALDDLHHQLETIHRRAEVTEQRAVETLIGRERLVLARQRVAALIQQRLQHFESTPWVRQLLRGPWSNHLVLAWLRYGETSADFRNALDFVENLLWIDDPESSHDPARLTRLRDTLPEQLGAGLAGVTLHDSEIQSLVAQLRSYLDAQIRQQHAPDFLFETDPTLAQSDVISQWQTPQSEDQPEPEPIDPALIARLHALSPGTWVEFRKSSEEDFERGKLCWTSPYTGHNLFVNRNGTRLRETTVHELARELNAGMARIIEGNRLLERTLHGLIDELQHALHDAPPDAAQVTGSTR